MQNAFIESFNSKLRDECLNEHVFTGLTETRRIIDAWRYDPNWFPLHSSLGLLMPKEFADQQGNGPPEQAGVSANRPLAPSPHQRQTLTESTHECGEVGEEASPPADQQTAAAICMTSWAAY